MDVEPLSGQQLALFGRPKFYTNHARYSNPHRQSCEITNPEKIRVRPAIESRPILMYTGVLNAFLRTAASFGAMIPIILAR